MGICPQVQVNVKEKGISEGNADNRNRIGDPQKSCPVVVAQIEKAVERDHEIARVPTSHRQSQERKHPF